MILEIIVFLVLVIFVTPMFMIYLGSDRDYYYTDKFGDYYHCYIGSDYLLCDKVGDSIGYD